LVRYPTWYSKVAFIRENSYSAPGVDKMAQVENRKLIRIGKTSLAVILPKSWLRHFNLDYGDEVEVESNSSIVIKRLDPVKERPKEHIGRELSS
jgi:antitoxin component of MazEF toxin-antitoxin module